MNSIAGSFPHTTEPAEKMLTVSPCVPRLIKSLARTYQETLSPMNELERAGIIHATSRLREYVCEGSEKIEAALTTARVNASISFIR